MSTSLGSIKSNASEQSSGITLIDDERNRMLLDWNDTKRPFPSEFCVHELFEEQVARTPDAVALVYRDSQLSYGELNARVNRLARYLRAVGVGPDARVGVCIERSAEVVIALLAVLKAGGAYVPLDPSYPPDRLRHMFDDSAPIVLLTHASVPIPLRSLLRADGVRPIGLSTDASCWEHESSNNLDRGGLTSSHLAYVIYTSGSTGLPKGVMIEHRGLSNLAVAQGEQLDVDANSRVLQFASFSFDAATWELVLAFCHGAALYIPASELVLAGENLAQVIEQYGITHVTLPPAVLDSVPRHADLRSVRTLVVAGDSPTQATVKRWAEGRRFINAYGPSETTVCATMHKCNVDDTGNPSIGRPIANTRIYILNDDLEPVPVGITGELYIGGVQVARGYWNRSDLTAERFIASPFVEGDRLYKTGDLARYLPNGNIEFLGRLDFQVKIRGFRIELGEVEARLAQHPAIREVVVLARSDVPGEKQLVAYYKLDADTRVDADDLSAHLKAVLPEYMVPSAYVELDAMPLSPNGKIDRSALPRPRQIFAGSIAPRTDTERAISEIWCNLLGVIEPRANVSFFRIGGHSLLAAALSLALRERFGVAIPLGEIFKAPTIAQLALRVENGARGALDDPVIKSVRRNQALPLSSAQEAVWFLEELTPSFQAYQFQIAYRLLGPLDVVALSQAINSIVRRHEIYRTTFERDGERPVQRVHAYQEVHVPLVDLSELHPSEQKQRYDELVQKEVRSIGPTSQLPNVRWTLVRLGADEHHLVEVEHHFLHDGWSTNLFIHELLTAYHELRLGIPTSLSELDVQFADYAVWEKAFAHSPSAERQLDYWRECLKGVPALLALPTDRPRKAERTNRGDAVAIEIDVDLCDALRDLAKDQGATLFMTMLTAFYILIQRYSGMDDICVGSAVANRNNPGVERLIGMLVNMVALRCDLSQDPTISELISRVRECTLGAYDNQSVPFSRVVKAVVPERSAAHNPLYQVAFSFHDSPLRTLRAGELELQCGAPINNGTAKFDISLIVLAPQEQQVGTSDSAHRGVTLYWEYSTDLFDRSTIETLAEQYRRLLSELVKDPTRRISSLSILDPREREQLLVGWNDTIRAYPLDRCIHEMFEAQVAKTPDSVALAYEDIELSYGELNARANRLARFLRSRGVGPDRRVALCVERSVEMVIGMLAVLKAGGAYVPLDASYPLERLRYILEDSAPTVLLTHASVSTAVKALLRNVDVPAIDLAVDTAAWEHESSANLDRGALTSRDLAHVIYTSGSTGLPKGAMIEHRGVVNNMIRTQEACNLTADDIVLQKAPFGTDVTLLETFWPLFHGAQLLLARPDGHKDPEYLSAVIQERRVTTVKLVPSMMPVLVEHSGADAWRTVRRVIAGSEALTGSLAKRFLEHFPHIELHNFYGPTEAAVYVVAYSCTVGTVPETMRIGRPISNTKAYILDASLEPVPVGVPGELYIGGVQIARGYWNRPQLTAERFIPSPFVEGDCLYKTGDLARYLADGNLEYLGRTDFQVKIRGFRIELGEIEARLAQHPAVREVAVLAREDTPNEKQLVAYYTLSDDADVSASSLRSYLQEALPEYMTPLAYVVMNKMPMTPGGKLDRKALPAPDDTSYVRREYEAPIGEAECAIARVWGEVLKLDRVGRQDKFFELGGHSLLIVDVIARLRKVGLHSDVRTFFTTSTLAELAATVTNASNMVQVPPNLISTDSEVITPEMLTLWH